MSYIQPDKNMNMFRNQKKTYFKALIYAISQKMLDPGWACSFD